jgi:uncharacterized protein YijF (DUF1287 family)
VTVCVCVCVCVCARARAQVCVRECLDFVVRRMGKPMKKIDKEKNTCFLDLVVRKMKLTKGVVDVQGLVQLCHTHLGFFFLVNYKFKTPN